MSILTELLARVKAVESGLQTGEIVRTAVVRHGEEILDLQRLQLFAGTSSSGEDIRPYYSEDLKPSGYFYSVETAGRYAAWKSSLNYPYNVERNPDAPNLYIVGKFHDELGVQFLPDSVAIVGTTPFAKGIIAKYGVNTFGLMPENWNTIFTDYGAYDEMMQEIKRILYV